MKIKSFVKKFLKYLVLFFVIGNISCSDNIHINKTLDTLPTIFPDYTNVTIPYNIAPLSFKLIDSAVYTKIYAIFENDMQQMEIKAKNGQFSIPLSSWKKLMKDAAGSTISVTIQAKDQDQWISYPAFQIFVAPEPVDSYLVYRLIEPGYDIWNEMGIYQRHVEDFHESTIINNKRTGYGCMNCHSFNMQNPEKMLFHLRASHPGTIMINGDKIEKLNTNTEQTLSALVYPSWHPSGNFVAFSVNDTKQIFHTTDPNRIEVFDFASDVVVYDVNRHEIITSTLLNSNSIFETFPSFSPDGKTMFFCSADTFPMPHEYNKLKYSLCAISFDPESCTFGTEVDTLYNAKLNDGKSVSFPRVSPDGKYLMFTLSGYGNFSIWHKDADLYIIDLQNNKTTPLSTLNSNDVDSYHSWSSNSRWVVFSSRRIDGLYTRPYIAYINDAGEPAKPFLLPQKYVDFYHRFMKSYNIPEFVTSKVEQNGFKLSEIAVNDTGIDVTFGGTR
ncbi:MAG: hypothetical protein LBV47_03570 [Bacteroidales bacterium]|jgi:hypothetical protein|nr:hypothetical protein [Bacteroidales bacterium]